MCGGTKTCCKKSNKRIIRNGKLKVTVEKYASKEKNVSRKITVFKYDRIFVLQFTFLCC